MVVRISPVASRNSYYISSDLGVYHLARMSAAVLFASLFWVKLFRIASCKSLVVFLAMGFTGPLIINNMKSRLSDSK